MMVFDSVAHEVDRDISPMQVIVGEIFLDHIALVTEADNEVCDAVVRVKLHDVPQYRSVSDLDHRLWADTGFFRQPGAHAARKNDALHAVILLSNRQGHLSYLRPSSIEKNGNDWI